MSYASEVAADSPRAYWRMGDASGLPQDSSGNARHMSTTVGTPTYNLAGATTDGNTAISLPGTAFNRFQTADHANLDLADVFTLEAWIKLAATGQIHTIISKGANAYHLRISATGALVLAKEATADIVTSTTTITDTTTWHHVVATKTGSTVKLYIDAVDVTGTVTNQTCADNTSGFRLGATGSGDPANAVFDEVAVYPTALSAARVLVHYNEAVPAGATFVPRVVATY